MSTRPNTHRPFTTAAAWVGLTVLTIGHGAEPGCAVPATTTPIVDAPATQFSETSHRRVGAQASRIEFDDVHLNGSMSVWYRLTYVAGGTRLRVYDHYAATARDVDPVMIRSERIAWWIANEVLGTTHRDFAADRLPTWARVHTGIDIGPSAGLMFALTYLDALTPGPLVGNLRVAGTGMVGLDGVVGPVKEIDVKVAAALLTRPDVIFTPRPPESLEHVTIVESKLTRYPTPGYTTGEWLNVAGFEQAGRVAATHPGTVAVVVVYDLRQALAWLCGRTSSATACEVARASANLRIGTY